MPTSRILVTRGSVLDSGCPLRLFASEPDEPIGELWAPSVRWAEPNFTAVPKAPEGWRSPRPGGPPLFS